MVIPSLASPIGDRVKIEIQPSSYAPYQWRAITPSLSSSSSAQWWYMAHPLLCVLQLFLHSRGKHQVDYYGEDFGGQASFLMDFFALNCFTFLQLVDYIIKLYILVKTNFCVRRWEKPFQNILLNDVMFETILLVIFGIITGLKIW